MSLRNILIVGILGIGYLFLPYLWSPGWIVMGSPPVVVLDQTENATWFLYIFNIHPYTRVLQAVAEFPDGSTWLLQAETDEEKIPRSWSYPTYRKVPMVLPPQAWVGRSEGPIKIRIRLALAWPKATGPFWDPDWQRNVVERVVMKTLYLERL